MGDQFVKIYHKKEKKLYLKCIYIYAYVFKHMNENTEPWRRMPCHTELCRTCISSNTPVRAAMSK